MSRISLFLGACLLALAPAAFAQTPAAAAPSAPKTPERSALDAQLMYQLLISELSFQNTDYGSAYGLMLHAARESGDAQLYERAIEMALTARDANAAMAAAKAWQQAQPQSPDPDRHLLQLAIGLNRLPDSLAVLQRMLARVPAAEKSAAITGLTRFYTRATEKTAAADLVEKVLAPELANRATGPAAWAAIGNLRLLANNKAAALAAARKGAALNPASDDVAMLAITLLDPPAEGMAELLQTYFAGPATLQVRMGYVRKLIDLQRYDQALEQVQRLTRDKPDFPDAWLVQGSIEFQNQALESAARSLWAYVALVAPAVAAPLNEELALTPRGLVQAYLLLSQIAEKQRDFAQAQSFLERIRSPQDAARVQLRRAMITALAGSLDDALALLDKLPDNDPDEARIKLNAQLQLLREHQREQQAYDLLAQERKRNPQDVDLMYEQALSAEKLGNLGEMESLLRAVIQLQPDYHAAYNALGYSLAERNVRLPEARALVAKALEFAPNDPFILDSLAWVEFRSGNHAQALRILQEAYLARPDAEIAAHLGEVLWAMNQREEASAAWRKGLDLNASNETLKSTILRLRGSL
ncbi:MAG: tetratricopeptide repeat protein [Betaproteobacteria bacterium]